MLHLLTLDIPFPSMRTRTFSRSRVVILAFHFSNPRRSYDTDIQYCIPGRGDAKSYRTRHLTFIHTNSRGNVAVDSERQRHEQPNCLYRAAFFRAIRHIKVIFHFPFATLHVSAHYSRARAVGSYFSLHSKAKQSVSNVECDGYSINYGRHPCREIAPFSRPFPHV